MVSLSLWLNTLPSFSTNLPEMCQNAPQAGALVQGAAKYKFSTGTVARVSADGALEPLLQTQCPAQQCSLVCSPASGRGMWICWSQTHKSSSPAPAPRNISPSLQTRRLIGASDTSLVLSDCELRHQTWEGVVISRSRGATPGHLSPG